MAKNVHPSKEQEQKERIRQQQQQISRQYQEEIVELEAVLRERKEMSESCCMSSSTFHGSHVP